jgi:hypothetical protein
MNDWSPIGASDSVDTYKCAYQLEHALPELQYVLAVVWRNLRIEVILQSTLISILENYMTEPAMLITPIVANNLGAIFDSFKRCYFARMVLFGVPRNIPLEGKSVRMLGA